MTQEVTMTTTTTATPTTRARRRIVGGIAAAAVIVPLGIAQATPAAAADLSPETVSMLQFMVAEEKLARDVYTALGEAFDARIFDNIARAEQRHMSSVEALLDRYGIVDPTEGDPSGVFDDARLQALYDSLVRTGSTSLTAALAAGATIERLDIADLQSAIATTDAADVRVVLSRLLSGSENHLAAFTSSTNGTSAMAAGRGPGGRGPWGQHRTA